MTRGEEILEEICQRENRARFLYYLQILTLLLAITALVKFIAT